MQDEEMYLRRCMELATNGTGNVAPNPMVGCVIVHKGRIIGEGFHAVFGGPHAEVVAVNAVKNKALLKDSTLYVNLEPCSHYGKTPPCADMIIKAGIPKVIVGSRDPYMQVQGRGIAKLRQAGIDVVEGVLKDDCDRLNNRFFTFHQKKRPYIILKWAQTLDGFIDKDRNNSDPHINWITDENTRMLVHRWRSEEQAIMVGTNTVLLDDPQLTVRDWHGKNPLRLVVDEKLVIPSSAKVFDNDAGTVVFNTLKNEVNGHIEYVKLNFTDNIIPQVLEFLYERSIQSLIVEGGREMLQSFIESGAWDEARIFSGNCFFFSGVRAPEIKGEIKFIESIGADKLTFILNSDQLFFHCR
ncbi:MAG TPA: bifunctional diaminohydroxyphosphoribosylaminopyrimidine deaminase/5-amino-6-(5-phosphoribosylamino)uracil reductase RibD [Bacteroidales bacterium]|nr:bifunctional diaminohydroxyphosphoribosylaminopyrimidine deaminase/5-amino-6-(5-phosphoribosylamino)uracil reductase RibD [Bacteroidales bacterium]